MGADADNDLSDRMASRYDELRRLARIRLADLGPGQTLQPTSLVHEMYLRLAQRDPRFEDTAHFFFAAARAMHDIAVEHARAKASLKRGGGRPRLDLERLTIAHDSPPDELLALSWALQDLEGLDPRKHRLVMLRFFAGCNVDEAARALGVSASTVAREWRFAKAWLHERLSGGYDLPSAGTPPARV
jgi:RNA polymerase sigma factor (TIGR02999 family)